MLLRICYTNLIEENNFFHKDNITRYSITFLVVFGLNTYFISKVNTVFLNVEQIKIILWLLIIFYIVEMIKNKEKDIKGPNKRFKKRNKEKEVERQENIIVHYAKLKNKYHNLIKTNHFELIPLIYAIMIYEDKNRPKLLRKLDYYLYKLDGKGRKFGIMGIYSKYYIDDENSIEIAIRRIEKIYYQTKNKKEKERIILNNYYKKNNIVNEILEITKEIKKFNQK